MIKFGVNASLAWEQKRADTKVVVQVSGFDDKVNILGLVTGTNKPPVFLLLLLLLFFLFQAHLVRGGGGVGVGGGLIETGDLFDREGLI